MTLVDIDPHASIPDRVPGYVQVANEISHMRHHYRQNENIRQVGPKGIGKSLSVEFFAAKEEIPLIDYDCSEDTKRSDLMTQVSVGEDEEVVFIPTVIPLAIMSANEIGGAILLLEEMNSLRPNVQKLVNAVADDYPSVRLPRAGEKITLDDDANLMVVGTLNPSSRTGGVFPLNEDLKDRMSKNERGYPDQDVLQRILKEQGVPDKIGSEGSIREMISSFAISVHSMAGNAVSYDFSPRSAVRFGRLWKQYQQTMNDEGKSYAMVADLFLNEYEPENRNEIIDELNDSFRYTYSQR